MRLSALYILLLAGLQTAGQTKGYRVAYLDSLAAAIDSAAHTYLVRNEEGELRPAGSSTVIGNDYTVFYFTADSTLVKVTSEWAVGDIQRTSFYFSNNRLFLVRSFTYATGGAGAPVSSGAYYFTGKRLIYRLEQGRELYSPERYWQTAGSYLRRAPKALR